MTLVGGRLWTISIKEKMFDTPLSPKAEWISGQGVSLNMPPNLNYTEKTEVNRFIKKKIIT
jgi:hypothetical protein